MRRYAIVFCLLCEVFFGQRPPSEPSRLEGKILDSISGQPVKKAVVVVRLQPGTEGGLAAYTDETGHFEFLGLEDGNWSAQVLRTGYVALGNSHNPATPKELLWKISDGKGPKEITLRLTPSSVVTGRVLDVDGEPADRAVISLLTPDGKPQNLSLPYVMTNDQGEYRLYQVPPGKYLLSVTYQPVWQEPTVRLAPKPGKPGQVPPLDDYVTTYHPSAAEMGRAVPVVVPAGGQVSGIDVRLQKASVVKVKGQVSGANGPFLMLSLMEAAPGSQIGGKSQQTLIKPDGSFEFDRVRPGRYLLMGMGPDQRQGKQWVEVGNMDVEGVRLSVNPPQTLRGKLRMEGEGTIPLGLHALLASRMVDPTHQAGGFAPVQPDGTFTLDQVYEGHYDLMLVKLQGPADDSYVSSIRLDKEEVLSEGLQIGTAPPPPLLVTLRNDGGMVQIKVATPKGEPVPAAHVFVIPDPPREHAIVLNAEGNTDDKGEVKLIGVAPGSYHAMVLEGSQQVDPATLRDPALIEKAGKPLVVKARESTTLEIELTPGAPPKN